MPKDAAGNEILEFEDKFGIAKDPAGNFHVWVINWQSYFDGAMDTLMCQLTKDEIKQLRKWLCEHGD